ncbi:tRNA pseudouridine(55) synthase TruB [Desulforamulus ferrireducens]|uniref:tRNA pseudouridine synthase B n=1 Tax=Desulforamulus ferrireducens TaxID=1833852 RepID=A0A1S6IX29_9FIRM|nr:tRNA pseudouridine(55) synthase TruB [Desulforamulus ferrireducens]AQS59334.1 tRNA pseudouridine(55) synthase TruB [Desulforamulus ferrireducens]
MDGIITILKPPGMTSHDVVAYVRRLTKVKKCGHTGTLDPGAAGVLPVCLGRATKLASFVTAGDKTYRAELTLGIATSTQDGFGEIVRQVDASSVTLAQFLEVFYSMRGEIEQIPPMSSAIKVDGKKLYELERAGKTIDVPSRKVTIIDLKVINSWDWATPQPRVLFDVTCSKGTYVRTLCSDIGKALGCGAYMSFLLRSRVANFDLQQAITLEQLTELVEKNQLTQALIPMVQAVAHLPAVEIYSTAVKSISSGGTLYPSGIHRMAQQITPEELVRIQYNNQLLGIFRAKQENQEATARMIFRPEVVFST